MISCHLVTCCEWTYTSILDDIFSWKTLLPRGFFSKSDFSLTTNEANGTFSHLLSYCLLNDTYGC